MKEYVDLTVTNTPAIMEYFPLDRGKYSKTIENVTGLEGENNPVNNVWDKSHLNHLIAPCGSLSPVSLVSFTSPIFFQVPSIFSTYLLILYSWHQFYGWLCHPLTTPSLPRSAPVWPPLPGDWCEGGCTHYSSSSSLSLVMSVCPLSAPLPAPGHRGPGHQRHSPAAQPAQYPQQRYNRCNNPFCLLPVQKAQ